MKRDLTMTRAVVTGATGGIGAAVSRALLARGAHVLLVGRNESALIASQAAAADYAGRVDIQRCDITSAGDRADLARRARSWNANLLVNCAGVSGHGVLDEFNDDQIVAAIATNLTAPILLCRDFVPLLAGRPGAGIINVGSVIGAIALPAYSVYAASKFGLRGFSEALRRELSNSGIALQYLAPRATRTTFNSAEVDGINATLGNAVDAPERVAAAFIALYESGRPQMTLGWPERLFVRINALLPSLVDRSISARLAIMLGQRSSSEAGSPKGIQP